MELKCKKKVDEAIGAVIYVKCLEEENFKCRKDNTEILASLVDDLIKRAKECGVAECIKFIIVGEPKLIKNICEIK